MAEQDTNQERTEQATAKRLREARERGQVPRSRELTGALVMIGGATALLLMQRRLGGGLEGLLTDGLARAGTRLDVPPATVLGEAIIEALRMLAPLMLVLIVIALLAPALTGGWNFSVKPLAPKLEKLNPLKGLKRIFGPKGLIELAKAMGKALVVGGAGVAILMHEAPDLLALGGTSVREGLGATAAMAGFALLILCASLLLIAAIDVPFQLWQHAKQLRMTRQEVRDEMKETDGRPEVKSRLRSLQQETARRRMMQDVPTADVVITNPTHFSVALKYDERRARAPVVVAKGVDLVAARIRELATEHDVTLFEAPPLARTLYRTTDIGQEIPPRLYAAVAQVLAWVYRVRRVSRYGGPWPDRPVIDIDEETT